MTPEFLTLLLQRHSRILPPDLPRSRHHSESLVLLPLLLVGRRMFLLTQFLVSQRSILLSSLPSLSNHRDPLLVRVLGLLLDSDNLPFGQEVVVLASVGSSSSGQGSQLPSSGTSSSILGEFFGGGGTEFVDFGKVGGGEDLQEGKGIEVRIGSSIPKKTWEVPLSSRAQRNQSPSIPCSPSPNSSRPDPRRPPPG